MLCGNLLCSLLKSMTVSLGIGQNYDLCLLKLLRERRKKMVNLNADYISQAESYVWIYYGDGKCWLTLCKPHNTLENKQGASWLTCLILIIKGGCE